MNTEDKSWMYEMERREERNDVDTQNVVGVGKTEKISVAEKIVLIGMRGVELFHAPDNTAYGAVSLDNGGTAIYPVNSNQMKSLLNQRYYKETRKVPSSEAMKGAVNVLIGRAVHECNEYLLSNRVAWKDGNIVYDMSNPLYETVTISKDGWTISQEKYPMFRRHNHQIPQYMPTGGGNVDKIFDIVNVHKTDRLMTLVHLVASLVPDIPHAAPNICGEQGSAKSTASKIFKALVDPSVIDTAKMPANEDRMHQMLSHHWYLVFDNVSYIQDWQSDIFCSGITGQATAVRTLYSDDDDTIFKYKMCIGFNGISYLATRSDLLDRSFTLQLEPINDDRRMSEEDVIEQFAGMRAEILGAMFDALSYAIKIYPTVEMASMPRMADFAKWGCAIAEGLGYTQKDFIDAYYAKIEESNMNAIEANPVAELIMALMKHNDVWEGSPTELWQELLAILSNDGMRREDVRSMKSASALGKSRDRIAPNLRRIGIDWQKPDRAMNRRGYRIIKTKTYKNGNPTPPMTRYDTYDTCAPYLDTFERDGIESNAHTIRSASVIPVIPVIDSEKKVYTSDMDSKLKHAVGKAVAKSDTMGAEISTIVECYPGSITSTEIREMLEERGKSLGIKERYGKWYV